MDHVYMCRPGENEELRFSLRSLEAHVPHDQVFVVGGWPEWLTSVEKIPLGVRGDTAEHIRTACAATAISDPFVLWMDDIYATEPVEGVPVLHNGPMRVHAGRTRWHSGHNATARWLKEKVTAAPLSYELHVPLIVHKGPMLVALARLREVHHRFPHKRSVYGNLAGLGGEYAVDSKIMNPRAPLPSPWVSSADATFASAVLPRINGLFPEPSRFER